MHVRTDFIRRDGGWWGEQMIKMRRLRRSHTEAASRQHNDFFKKAKEEIAPAPNDLLEGLHYCGLCHGRKRWRRKKRRQYRSLLTFR